MQDLISLQQDAMVAIEHAQDINTLETIRVDYLGKKVVLLISSRI